jgi:adenosylhomocysteine nucleosidase
MAPLPVQAALLAALPQEVQPFLRRRRARRRRGTWPWWDFIMPAGMGVVLLTGMGETHARAGFAFLIDHFRPEMLLAVGFGGAVLPAPAPGEVVLGTGYYRYQPESGLVLPVPAPPAPAGLQQLLDRARERRLPLGPGTMVSTPEILPKSRLLAPLLDLTLPVVDLETAALAHLAREQGLPFVALRAVTDGAGEEIPGFIKTAVRRGKTPTPLAALGWLGKDARRLTHLTRLWQRSRRAAAHLALVLEAAVEWWWGEGRGSMAPVAQVSSPVEPPPTPPLHNPL